MGPIPGDSLPTAAACGARAQTRRGCVTDLLVLLVLAPDLLGEAGGGAGGSVGGDDAVVDQRREVRAHRGQVPAVRQPCGDTEGAAQPRSPA